MGAAAANADSRGDEGPLPPTPGNFADLTFQITTSKGPLLPLEPMTLTIRLANRTPQAVLGHRVSAPDGNLFKIHVASKGKPFEEFPSMDSAWQPLVMSQSRRVLEPGFEEVVRGFLCFAARPDDKTGRYLLPSPGDYRVKATLTNLDRTVTIESNVLDVSVAVPQGEDAAAYDYLRAVPHRAFLMFSHPVERRDGPEFTGMQTFIDKFPTSRYAVYAYWRMGMDFCRPGATDDDRRQAIAFLEKAAATKDFFLSDDVLAQLVGLYVQVGELDKAKERFLALAAGSSDGRLVERALSRLGTAILETTPKHEVRVRLHADWDLLKKRPDLKKMGIGLDAKELAWFPLAGKSLNPLKWDTPALLQVPAGTYRVTLRGGKPGTDFHNYVILVPEVKVTGSMDIEVHLTEAHLAELDRLLDAQKAPAAKPAPAEGR
jgi:hypothetical protein